MDKFIITPIQFDENGIEFWYARELQLVLNYKEWRKFENVIKKACDTHNKIGKIVRKAIKQAGRNYARRFTYT